jgi:DNA-binding MarR family transcriptional regulator
MTKTAEAPTPGFLVWRLSMKLRATVDRAVAPLGLTHAQYSLLASLLGMQRSGQRPSQRHLAAHTGLEPIYVSKLARTLEAAGFVARVTDPADSRAVQLSLTDSGLDVITRAIDIVHDLQERLTAPLGGVQSRQTRTFVRTLQTLLAQDLDPTLRE